MTSGVAGVAGTVLERRYRIDTPVARGGMSTVYTGIDLRLDRPVAIKVMDSGLAENPTFLRRFELEARAAARLHHPNVVAVHDQGMDAGLAYLVMELVEGGTLRDLLDARGALDPALALSVTEPVATALAAAHRAGLVHRDVKPENVLIGADGAVKVADFGLVRAVAGSSAATGNVILGTVAYLSPEQVATGDAGPRSDVYSLGVLLYEMLTGTQPYTGDSALSVAYRHVHEDVPAPGERRPELAPALDNLVLLATRREPAARPADAAQFLAAVQHVRTGLGLHAVTVAAPVGGTERTARMRPVAAGPAGTRAYSRAQPPPATEPAAQPRGAAQATPAAPRRDPTAVYQRDRRRSRRLLVIVTVLVLLLAALVGTGAWWFGSGRWTAVPSVTGMDLAAARHALADADLDVHTTRRRDDAVPEGSVVSTEPRAGADALRDADVTLVVSSGRPTVPEVRPGTSRREAEVAVRAAGLTPKHDPGRDRYDADVPKGAVLGTLPDKGTRLRTGAEVTVVLSRGPAPVHVPDVAGEGRSDAFAALREAGLDPYELPGEFSESVPADHVVSTDPAGGATVPGTGSKRVGVVLSTAVSVPDVTGKKVGKARKALREADLSVSVRQLLHRSSSRVVGQSVRPGTSVEPGAEVTLFAFP